jgi:hypothetical protein
MSAGGRRARVTSRQAKLIRLSLWRASPLKPQTAHSLLQEYMAQFALHILLCGFAAMRELLSHAVAPEERDSRQAAKAQTKRPAESRLPGILGRAGNTNPGTCHGSSDGADKASPRALFSIRIPTAATIAPSSGNLPVLSFE